MAPSADSTFKAQTESARASARAAAAESRSSTPALGSALELVAATWGILLAGRMLGAGLGPGISCLVAFGLCTVLTLERSRLRPNIRGAVAGAGGLGAGWALLPELAQGILRMGDTLGIPAPAPGQGADGPLWVGATVVLAPIFEEIVYRKRLLPALEDRIGSFAALVLSSAAFALPHTEPWAMAGSFAAGLVLGGIMLTSRNLALCIGVHAGLNLRLAAL